MDEEKKITKIVINKDDELTDIVTAILESQNERIILTFTEESDLLISPINLKVLLETADESEKLLVAQIIKNPTGLRNANLAGISTIETPTFPMPDIWEKEELDKAKRLNPPKAKPLVEEKSTTEPKEELPVVSDFQKRVDDAIERSRDKEIERKEATDDLLISLDEDLPTKEQEDFPIIIDPDLSNIDFNKKTEDPNMVKPSERIKERRGTPFSIKAFVSKMGSFFSNIPIPTKLKKLVPLIGISILLLTVLIGLIYINTAILVKVKIYVEAKEVSFEVTLQGDENIKEVDFENLKIPTKSERVEKSRSTNIKATGKAFRGEKATGKVNITYIKDGCNDEVPALDLPAGHTLSTGGKVYTLDTATSVRCTTLTVAPITAIEVGEEYNLASGQLFTFQGYSSNQLLALNNSGAITGGSKEEYTVLSKADVDTAAEDLRKIAVEEGESELKEKPGNWEIITDSIKSEIVADSIKTDVAIGAQANDVNLSIKTKSTASYFLKDGFDEGISSMLTEKAKENNLFETDKEWDLELDKDIEKEITVTKNNTEGIEFKLVAKSSVKPIVNKEDILNDLKEKNWEEGQTYLKSLGFSDKEPSIVFLPEKFPESLKRFPSRRGGVLISVENVN